MNKTLIKSSNKIRKYKNLYNVIRNNGEEFHTNNYNCAWEFINSSWCGYTVYNQYGDIREEFIPF